MPLPPVVLQSAAEYTKVAGAVIAGGCILDMELFKKDLQVSVLVHRIVLPCSTL
jgi:hypothetical protein